MLGEVSPRPPGWPGSIRACNPRSRRADRPLCSPGSRSSPRSSRTSQRRGRRSASRSSRPTPPAAPKASTSPHGPRRRPARGESRGLGGGMAMVDRQWRARPWLVLPPITACSEVMSRRRPSSPGSCARFASGAMWSPRLPRSLRRPSRHPCRAFSRRRPSLELRAAGRLRQRPQSLRLRAPPPPSTGISASSKAGLPRHLGLAWPGGDVGSR